MGFSGLDEAKTPPERAARKFTIEVERVTEGSTKPEIAFDANLAKQANNRGWLCPVRGRREEVEGS